MKYVYYRGKGKGVHDDSQLPPSLPKILEKKDTQTKGGRMEEMITLACDPPPLTGNRGGGSGSGPMPACFFLLFTCPSHPPWPVS